MRKYLIIYFIVILALTAGLYCLYKKLISLKPPVINQMLPSDTLVSQRGDSLWVCGPCWLHHSNTGLWELYYEGNPYERGLRAGKLSKDLIYFQEKAFVNQLREMIPSENYLGLLNKLVLIFNHNIDEYVSQEMLLEIYGISRSASTEFSDIGTNYQRILNYHAAHDIGHMIQNYHLAGCTSFGLWAGASSDSSLWAGRNFDFYMGDAFAQNKIINFVKPDSGYGFVSLSWGGMAGVVSGMNEKGLAITINAAKSPIPLHVATPVSLLARNILQYAGSISQAYTIAAGSKTFVSESYLIASAADNTVCIIEKNPDTTILYDAGSNSIICTNHFQSPALADDPLNIIQMEQTASLYRFRRCSQLLSKYRKNGAGGMAAILRDPYGLNNINIGFGNEKAVNQFIAHHSVIFKPGELKMWVSTQPWQLGTYVCYDLGKVLTMKQYPKTSSDIYEKHLSLHADTLLLGEKYRDFQVSSKIGKTLMQYLKNGNPDPGETQIELMISNNPRFYLVYYLAGMYYYKKNAFSPALDSFRKALNCEIPYEGERQKIMKYLENIYLKTAK